MNKAGESLGVPVDDWNHLIDPLRYAFEELDYVGMWFG